MLEIVKSINYVTFGAVNFFFLQINNCMMHIGYWWESQKEETNRKTKT
jgi:hypothetical protein